MSDAKTDGPDEDRGEDTGHASRGGSDRDNPEKPDDGANGEESEDDPDEDEDAKKKPSIFRKPLFWIILIVVVTVLVVFGVLYWLNARQFESTDDAFVDTHIVRIAPQVGGTLVKVADVDNRHVEAGTLLGVIQPTGPEAQLAEAQANVTQSLAQVAQARAQVTAAVAQRNQAAAQSRGPLATAVKAEQDLARYQQLAQIDRAAVSSQQLDQARATAGST
ncbi:HlyD family secretion protein, partial [uncultured Sphingomonas sp.]